MTVAASSFDMTITDPASLLGDIDGDRLQNLLGKGQEVVSSLQYVEPPAKESPRETSTAAPTSTSAPSQALAPSKRATQRVISGKVQTLGDFIDTDALAPNEALVANLTPEGLGEYCLYHTHPDFRSRVKEGFNIVVAGKAFGVGSSRENAVTALMGTGVQCVIARSFAFIYARNQPNLGLLGIVMDNEDFYKQAVDDVDIDILVDERIIKVGGQEFEFTLSDLEIRLWETGGISAAFAQWGKKTLENITTPSIPLKGGGGTMESTADSEKLRW